MSDRVEFEQPVRIGVGEGWLFVSSGRCDDYLELTLLEGTAPASPELKGLRDLLARCPELSLDLHEGPPALISVTALYINDPVRRSLPARERVATILVRLAEAVGTVDFGDLLPDGLKSKAPATEMMRREPGPMEAQVEMPAGSPTAAAVATRPVPAVSLSDLARSGRLERARGFAARGQNHKALRLLEEVLRGSPACTEAEELSEAIRQTERREKRAKREPRNPRAHLEAGFSYLSLERNGDAASALEQATRLQPDLYLAHLLLGIALHREGDVPAASRAYRRAAQLRPADSIHSDLLSALERGEPPIGLAEAGHDRPTVPQRQPRGFAWAG